MNKTIIMERREKIQQLENERRKEVEAINDKYTPKFKELKYGFSLDDIKADGWIKGSQCHNRGNKNEWEYDKRIPNHPFWTRTVNIVFGEKNEIIELITNSGCQQRNIVDMEDLNYYFENNK